MFASRPELAERSSRLTIGQLAELQGLEPAQQLIDVRAAAETAKGTIPGAVEIPLAVLADSLDGLDRDLPVVVYCASGYRSQVAASRLSAAGFRDVSDLLGGYGAWEAAGLPAASRRRHWVKPSAAVVPGRPDGRSGHRSERSLRVTVIGSDRE